MLCILQNGENCQLCISSENHIAVYSRAQNIVQSHNLNQSQKDAVLSCVSMRDCHHNNTVKLIWGPPGTGKTKTVASLLFSLLKFKTRTLICAPTNNAVLEVASRLQNLVKESLEHDSDAYGSGDILVFGNKSRMKVDGYKDLQDVFLDNRADNLLKCFAPSTGWKHHLESAITLLENPKKEYRLYRLQSERDIMSLQEFTRQKHSDAEEVASSSYKQHEKNDDPLRLKQWLSLEDHKKNSVMTLKSATYSSYKLNEKTPVPLMLKQSVKKEDPDIEEQYLLYKEEKRNSVMTMKQFLKQKFSSIGEELKVCMQTLYTHLPTSLFPFEEMKKIPVALDSLKTLEISLSKDKSKQTDEDCVDEESVSEYRERLNIERDECLLLLRSLIQTISLPNLTEKYGVEKFCLMNASLIFCTAASSTRLFTEGTTPVKFLVIDEAAMLKECESTIPLQLPGLHHVILIGDEKQLPSVVKSKVLTFYHFL